MKVLTTILEGCGSRCRYFKTTPRVDYYRCYKVDKVFYGGDTSNNGFPKVCTLPEVESGSKKVSTVEDVLNGVEIPKWVNKSHYIRALRAAHEFLTGDDNETV